MRKSKLSDPQRIEDLTVEHVVHALSQLKAKGREAWEAFFCGLGWPEGINYCWNENYVRMSAAPGWLTHRPQSAWWLWRYFGRSDEGK